ncbi:MAG: class I SAM-dependent methyltransferase [Methanoregula sp.]|nr:class I SAM-dependent methyltransferase [Methanoregula sp.]
MADDKAKSLQNLYEKEYVEKFETDQSPFRISRLMQYVSLPKDSHVADFGCGNGMLLACIHNQVRTYSGVDFSECFIIEARKRQTISGISNAEFFCESIESFCSRNSDTFDAGFVMDLAEHVYDPEWAGILAAIHRSLKSGGKLYLHTPNAEFFLEMMKKKNLIFHQFEEHVAVRHVSQNIQLLEDAGFFKYKIKMLPHYNILRSLHFLSFIPVIGKYFKARIFIIAEK